MSASLVRGLGLATAESQPWTDIASAVSAIIAATFTAATFVVAVVAARYAKRQVAGARAQLDQARDLAREQAQPYVVIYAQTRDQISPQLVDLVIENLGATGAREVRITAKPPLVRTASAGDGSEEVALPMPIPFLAPGQRWQTFWDSAITRKDVGLPRRFEVTITHRDSTGRHHQEAFVLDWDVFLGRLFPTEKTVHHAGEALEQISTTLTAWAASDDVARVAIYDGVDHDRHQAQEADAAAQAREAARQRLDAVHSRLFPQAPPQEHRADEEATRARPGPPGAPAPGSGP